MVNQDLIGKRAVGEFSESAEQTGRSYIQTTVSQGVRIEDNLREQKEAFLFTTKLNIKGVNNREAISAENGRKWPFVHHATLTASFVQPELKTRCCIL